MIPKLVIVIDDDKNEKEIMRYVFRKAAPRIHCISFIYPILAVKQICDDAFPVPDYIFIDINMPIMSGAECLLELRKVNKLKNIPIVMLSTSIRGNDADNLRKRGATHTFQKPFGLNGYTEILRGLNLIAS